MTIETFTQKAVEGGFEYHDLPIDLSEGDYGRIILIDPLAWQAVGKTEKWETEKKMYFGDVTEWHGWLLNMHNMIDHLAEGKDLQSFIKSL